MVTTFYGIQWPISHYKGQPKCPIGNGSNSNYHKFSTQTYFSQRDLKISLNINEEMLEDGAKFFRIPILFPWLHVKYSKQFLLVLNM